MALVVILLTFVVVPRTPTDIFPDINIPVIALVWNYAGLQPQEMEHGPKKQVVSRRFNRQGRNTLWQTDLKYGPYLPDPNHPGHKLRTYLIAIIDDATRFVVQAEFYANQKLPVLEDAFRKAILRCGTPDNLYLDNGKIFVSQWLRLACAKLRIRHLNTKPTPRNRKAKSNASIARLKNFYRKPIWKRSDLRAVE